MSDLRKIEITLKSGKVFTGYYTELRHEALDRMPKCKFVYDVTTPSAEADGFYGLNTKRL